jgi:DNA-binding NarL/FixJ family response regulator
MTITILLADDHQIFRQGLRALLDAESDLCVIGEASDGFEAMRQAEHLKPDIVVTDLRIPGHDGIEIIKRSKKVLPETAVIVLSMYDDAAYVVRALDSGARGYVLKESSAGELLHAIHEVVNGGCYLSSSINKQDIETYKERTRSTEIEMPF